MAKPNPKIPGTPGKPPLFDPSAGVLRRDLHLRSSRGLTAGNDGATVYLTAATSKLSNTSSLSLASVTPKRAFAHRLSLPEAVLDRPENAECGILTLSLASPPQGGGQFQNPSMIPWAPLTLEGALPTFNCSALLLPHRHSDRRHSVAIGSGTDVSRIDQIHLGGW